MSEKFKVTAKVEHGDQVYIDHRNVVRAEDMAATRANIRSEAPVGSTITWDVEKR